ncbi:DUF3152 domain-containing protein [Embleya sp. AB8]|uniref:DUF3152 domain-containing protein n=1 Tax=Embleya sp. AB8 TaxID=3156304 RepID=UPI003C78A75B
MLLLIAVVPRISGPGGGAPAVDSAASPAGTPGARPTGVGPRPDEPSAQRELPDRPAASPDVAARRPGARYPLDPRLRLGGDFATVPGEDAAPGTGKRYTYRVEIEQGLALDGPLFAETVQRTLNDPRSWSHDGLTFARTDAGTVNFVVRLASPGTLHRICSPIVGDTSVANVSCNASGTPWVMINAWRWAQGSTAYDEGEDVLDYRRMLIDHEVGHRLGHQHETRCGPGGLAPVMMQQTKSREAADGTLCTANPWPYPKATE